MAIQVHLVDGTYELFRHFYGARRAAADQASAESSAAAAGAGGPEGIRSGPPVANPEGVSTGGPAVVSDAPLVATLAAALDLTAVRGVVTTVLQMLETGATHIGVATDHVIESFRNRLWPGYKTGDGIDPTLRSQFEPLELALDALGVAVWAMVEYEADDALAAAARIAGDEERVAQVCIWTPDKDLAQCVRDKRVVQVDRRSGIVRDEDGVVEKFGVAPRSIPDYLALVGDSADGFPGLPGWGAKSAARVLARHVHIEDIPQRAADWAVRVQGGPRLAATLNEQRDDALLFRRLATLRADLPLFDDIEALRWPGPTPSFARVAELLGAPELADRANAVRPEGAGS